VTIPKEIRAKLNATLVYFEVENGVVTIKPVSDAAGSLTEYSKNAKPAASMKQMKDQAREKSVREKAFKKSSRH
jgi:virulence-associated protein VagC